MCIRDRYQRRVHGDKRIHYVFTIVPHSAYIGQLLIDRILSLNQLNKMKKNPESPLKKSSPYLGPNRGSQTKVRSKFITQKTESSTTSIQGKIGSSGKVVASVAIPKTVGLKPLQLSAKKSKPEKKIVHGKNQIPSRNSSFIRTQSYNPVINPLPDLIDSPSSHTPDCKASAAERIYKKSDSQSDIRDKEEVSKEPQENGIPIIPNAGYTIESLKSNEKHPLDKEMNRISVEIMNSSWC
eukprot:TRINITY_DN1006_c0_g1_i2.p1 TRINITY_DN1006_c0_g1~~TRINITY_DN1006_c0_g1_i2.p1  ORF type:complete len:260 (+),score=43.68 TRINITY_DN1006_c0_g1_i2:64-780(+)